jgi:hypothetical protein
VFRTSYGLTLTDCFAEGDERVKVESATYAQAAISGAAATNDSKGGGLGRTMGTYIDDSFNWDDIKWLRKSTKLPIVAKGVQTAEDAVLAMEHGLDGIVITNHGGRNLDTYDILYFPRDELREDYIDKLTDRRHRSSPFLRSGDTIPKCFSTLKSTSTPVFGAARTSSKPYASVRRP